MKQTQRALVIFTVILLAVAAILVPARLAPILRDSGLPGLKPTQSSEDPSSDQTLTLQVSAQRVQTEPAYRETLTKIVRLPAELHAATRVEVFPETAGTLTELPVRVGSWVEAGQIIGRVDSSRPGARFEPSPVRAPIAGTLTAVHADVGARVNTATPVFRIETLNELELRVEVPERYIKYLHSGMRAELHLPTLSSTRIPVQVKRISPVIDATSRAKEVYFRPMSHAENPQARELPARELPARELPVPNLQSGMFGELFLPTQHRPEVVTVPRSALIERETGTTVFVVNDDVVSERKVELGITLGGRSEIISGIEPQDEVIIAGQAELNAGDYVQPVQRNSRTQESGS